MDPVQLSDIVSVFQDQCAQAIWAHNGIVNKQMGDGLMAIFNFPIKIERHAEAAVTTALEIQRRCKATLATIARPLGEAEALGIGVGVHTGEVEIRDADIAGIGVHIAARVLDVASPGELMVSAAVPMLVAGSGFEFEDRGEHHLKGVSETWRLFALRS